MIENGVGLFNAGEVYQKIVKIQITLNHIVLKLVLKTCVKGYKPNVINT